MIANLTNVKIYSFRKGLSKKDDPYASCKIVDEEAAQIYDMFTMKFDDIEKLEIAATMDAVDMEININQGFNSLQFGEIISVS